MNMTGGDMRPNQNAPDNEMLVLKSTTATEQEIKMETVDMLVGDSEMDVEEIGLDVEDSLRRLKYWRGEMERAVDHHKVEVGKADAWLGEQKERFASKIAFHEANCTAYAMVNPNQKTITLINGVIKTRAGRDSVVVIDEDELANWAKEQGKHDEFFRTKTTVAPDKPSIMKYVTQGGGELPLGVDIVTGETKYTVETH